MRRFLAIVLLTLFLFVTIPQTSNATDIAPTEYASYVDQYQDGTLDFFLYRPWLLTTGSNWNTRETHTAHMLFDTSGLANGSYWLNLVLADFLLPSGNDEPQIPEILRPITVGTYIDDEQITESDYMHGTPFVSVDFPQLRGATFSFDVSDQVNASIFSGNQWLTFTFSPGWDVSTDYTTFLFGTPENPFVNFGVGDFSVMSIAAGLYVTLGDQAFTLAETTPLIPEPATIALMAIGTILLARRRR